MWKYEFCDFSKSILYPLGLKNLNVKRETFNFIDDKNICLTNFLQLLTTSLISILLILTGLYLIWRHRNRKRTFFHNIRRKRRYNVAKNQEDNDNNDSNDEKKNSMILFTFHNLRSSIELILFVINSLELCRALLPLPPLQISHSGNGIKYRKNLIKNNLIIFSPPFMVINSISTIMATISLIGYHRILELKNLPDLLYLSIPLEIFLSFIRIYQINFDDTSIIELESFLSWCNSLCLILLAVISAFTIYKERFKNIDKKPIDLKIGYKHSISSFYSKTIFWWLTPLLWRGYAEPLEQEDLGSLREEDSARAFYDQFLLIYKKECSKKKCSLWLCYMKLSWKWFTLGGVLKLLGDLFALIGPLSIHQIVEYIEVEYNQLSDIKEITKSNNFNQHSNLSADKNSSTNFIQIQYNLEKEQLLQYYNSLLINNNILKSSYSMNNLLLNYNNDFTTPSDLQMYYYYPGWMDLLKNGWIIAWCVLIASLAQGGLSQGSTHLLNMTGIRLKTSIQGLIYRKTLLLSSSCLDTKLIDNCSENGSNDGSKSVKKSNGKMKTDIGSITNLMSEDALNVMSFFWIAHYVWAIPLKIGLVMYLLYLKLGISAVIGSLVCIFTMTPLQFLIGKAMSKNSEISAQCTDERLKRTNDIFLGIKLIKLNAWENVFCDKIRLARNKELKYLNKDSFYWTLMTFLTHISSVLITFVTLAVYVKLEGDIGNNINITTTTTNQSEHIEFTASRLFSALALFNQLTVPLLIFPITVPIIISAIVSTKRLEGFLQEAEVQKDGFEGIKNMARILCKSDASLDMYENSIKSPILTTSLTSSEPSSNQSTLESKTKTENMKIINDELIKNSNESNSGETIDNNTMNIVKTKLRRADNYCQTPPKKHFSRNLVRIDRKIQLMAELNSGDKCSDDDDKNTIENIELNRSNDEEFNKQLTHKQKFFNNESRKNSRYSFSRGSDSSIDSNISSKMRNSRRLTSGRESIHFHAIDTIAVSILDATFSWDNCKTSLLKIDELHIPKGKLTIVIGKNGSGKSSLLAALLKEIHITSGEITWNKYSTIAYVPQTPWLLNATIRENILFGESFRPKRYEKVLESCALKPDIELMPDSDMTVIGERGIMLSGGQKQRIAVARSLYSSANVIIMDDPLSSLDNEVAKHVFDNSIKKMLLKTNRTVILVTQKLHLVPNADYVIVMNEGAVQATGTYNDIEIKYPELISEWNSVIAKSYEKDHVSPGKTARERWKLFKNVSRIGLQRPQETEQDQMMSIYLVGLKVKIKIMELLQKKSDNREETQSLFVQPKRRPSIFGSRHLIYDIPLPIDECQNDDIIIKRRSFHGSKRSLILMGIGNFVGSQDKKSDEKKNIMRVNSLQPTELKANEIKPPVVRNISSPGRFYNSKGAKTNEGEIKPKTGFRQFLNRMSSRRSNVGTKLHRTISATNSIQSISEESHPTLTRNESISSDLWDCESIHDLAEINKNNLSSVNDEERKYGEIPLQIYMLYLKSCGLRIVIIFFTTALIWQCLRVYTDVWLQNWTDVISAADNDFKHIDRKNDVKYYFNMYAIISGICILMTLISTPAGQMGGCNSRKILHDQLLKSILGKPLHFFQITPLGRIINRFSNDMAIVDKKIAPTSQRLLQFTLLCLFAILINLAVTPWFILLTIPICIAYYVIQKFYRCSSRELQRLENITNSPVISHFNETIQGVTTIRAYSQESRFTETLFKYLESNTIAFIMLNTSNRWLGIALDYLGGIIVFLSIITALLVSSISNGQKNNGNNKNVEHTDDVYLQNDKDIVNETSSLSPSLVGLAINYTLLIPIYLNWVVKLLADMEMYIGSVERIAYYQNENFSNSSSSYHQHSHHYQHGESNNNSGDDAKIKKKIFKKNCCVDEKNKENLNRNDGIPDDKNEISFSTLNDILLYKSVPISWPQKGDIFFKNVSLKYQGQKENVITDLTLKIPFGQKIGICGRTGSGKSSLALSLFSVLNVVNGKIFIDEIDIATINPDEIRSRLSIIPQDVHLFQTTIRENLDPHGYYSDLELWNCLEMAQLKEIVNKMPMGLEAQIIEGGNNFSAGQRQLFCLARSVLRGSVCLVLDEATSSLDSLTEEALMDAAHNAFHGRTIITIAHRLSTLLSYDRIIVLENGNIIEDGTPSELQKIPNGKFLAMLSSGHC